MKDSEKIALLRKALTDLANAAPSGDELRLLCVGVQPGQENGVKLHEQCDRLTAARAQASVAIRDTAALKRKAFTPVVEEDGIRLGIAEEDELGYLPQRMPTEIPFAPYLKDGRMDTTGRLNTFTDARRIADELNQRLFGLSAHDGWMIAAESMKSGMKR